MFDTNLQTFGAANSRPGKTDPYADTLLNNSTQPTGSVRQLHSRKRGRSRTRSRSPSRSAPSASRSPHPTDERRRLTVRSGKDKGRRQSYSRSPTPDRRRQARTPPRTIPGLLKENGLNDQGQSSLAPQPMPQAISRNPATQKISLLDHCV